MITRARDWIAASLLLLALGDVGATEVSAPRRPSLVGIDHLPTVVENLEAATASFRRLGFSIKPGRHHEDGLRNAHVKFADGSGIELIAPPVPPTDVLTRTYAEFLRHGEGPAFVSFHARDTAALTAALVRAGIDFKNEDGLVSLTGPDLDFIFFVSDNRSPTDRPEHFTHPNTAVAMTEVWLALDGKGRESLRRLMRALGAVEGLAVKSLPSPTHAEIFEVRNGRVVVVAEDRQRPIGRRVVGVEFRILNPRVARPFIEGSDATTMTSNLHGLWLRLTGQP